jgi:hypothetical protein
VILDLTRPEHREALAYACRYRLGPRYETDALVRDAARALSSPSDSAVLVRALLEKLLGAIVLAAPGTPTDPVSVVIAPCLDGRRQWLGDVVDMAPVFTVYLDRIPALILALLACTDAAGALAALREAGR